MEYGILGFNKKNQELSYPVPKILDPQHKIYSHDGTNPHLPRGHKTKLTKRADIVEKAFVSSCHFSLSNDNQQINTCSLGRVFGLKHFLELDLTAYFCMCTQFVALVCPHISVWSQRGIVGDYTVAGAKKAALAGAVMAIKNESLALLINI